MNVDKNILSDNEGESIGSVGSYVQQYKDIEAGKRSTANNPASFNKSVSKDSQPLPKSWKPETEKEILLHYCKRFGCLDFTDLDDKKGQIAAAINRLFSAGLTPDSAGAKLSEHITPDDLFQEEESTTPTYGGSISEKAKQRRKLKANIAEVSYAYHKGLSPLTEQQEDLSMFLDPKDLVFSSDEHSFFLAVLPGKEKSFDKLFKFTPKEQLVYEMFKEQLGDEHKAKKLVLMSRLMNESEPTKEVKSTIKNKVAKKTTKKKVTKKVTSNQEAKSL